MPKCNIYHTPCVPICIPRLCWTTRFYLVAKNSLTRGLHYIRDLPNGANKPSLIYPDRGLLCKRKLLNPAKSPVFCILPIVEGAEFLTRGVFYSNNLPSPWKEPYLGRPMANGYRVVPGDRNWHIETADWNLAGFFTIFRNLLAGIWGSFLRFIETGFRNWLAAFLGFFYDFSMMSKIFLWFFSIFSSF